MKGRIRKAQGTGHRAQSTGHRAQGAEHRVCKTARQCIMYYRR